MRNLIVFIVVCALFVGFAGNAFAQQANPVAVPFSIDFVHPTEGTKSWSVIFPNAWWRLSNSGWNDRYTGKNSKIENNDFFGVSYPLKFVKVSLTGLPDLYVLDSNGTYEITEGMVNAYVDSLYPGAEKIEEPSFNYNCHGYSTGKYYWVCASTIDGTGAEISPGGYVTLIADDWEECPDNWDNVDNTYLYSHSLSDVDHSIRIEEISRDENGTLMFIKTSEKSGIGGTYRYDVDVYGSPIPKPDGTTYFTFWGCK